MKVGPTPTLGLTFGGQPTPAAASLIVSPCTGRSMKRGW